MNFLPVASRRAVLVETKDPQGSMDPYVSKADLFILCLDVNSFKASTENCCTLEFTYVTTKTTAKMAKCLDLHFACLMLFFVVS